MSQFLISNVSYIEPKQADQGSNSTSVATYRYPQDIGSTDKGHYMLFNIYVQQLSKLNTPGNTIVGAKNNLNTSRTAEGTVNAATGLQALGKLGSDISNNSTVQNIWGGLGTIKNAILNKAGSTGQSINQILDVATTGTSDALKQLTNQTAATFNNNVARLKDNIAIYMPDTLAFTSQAHYDTPDLSGDALTIGSVGVSMLDSFNKGQTNPGNIAAFLAQVVKKIAPGAPILGSQSFNAAFVGKFGSVNPMVEVIYSKPELRSFRFDYMFNPRSKSEAEQVQRIIRTFVYHQAPEIKDGTGGYFLVPPSVFDIEFYYRGKKNPNIPKITTCVLEDVTVDYAAGGRWATFETNDQTTASLGGTGMPVTIRLSLAFRETRYITKQYLSEEEQIEKSVTVPLVPTTQSNVIKTNLNPPANKPGVNWAPTQFIQGAPPSRDVVRGEITGAVYGGITQAREAARVSVPQEQPKRPVTTRATSAETNQNQFLY